MTAHEYLKQYKYLKFRIEYLLDVVAKKESKTNAVSSIDYEAIRVDKSLCLEAPFIKAIEQLYDLEERVSREIREGAIKMQEIITRIETMSDKELSTILMYRYIQDYTFKEISQRMYQSETSVRRKYKEALSKIKIADPAK